MNKVITITRQFGSGGREIGKKLAEAYGIPFYDNELSQNQHAAPVQDTPLQTLKFFHVAV